MDPSGLKFLIDCPSCKGGVLKVKDPKPTPTVTPPSESSTQPVEKVFASRTHQRVWQLTGRQDLAADLIQLLPLLKVGRLFKVGSRTDITAGTTGPARLQVRPANLTVEISFGHGARHLDGLSVSVSQVESAIQNQIWSALGMTTSASGSFWGRVIVGGTVIEYRAHTLPSGIVDVGTYYVPK